VEHLEEQHDVSIQDEPSGARKSSNKIRNKRNGVISHTENNISRTMCSQGVQTIDVERNPGPDIGARTADNVSTRTIIASFFLEGEKLGHLQNTCQQSGVDSESKKADAPPLKEIASMDWNRNSVPVTLNRELGVFYQALLPAFRCRFCSLVPFVPCVLFFFFRCLTVSRLKDFNKPAWQPPRVQHYSLPLPQLESYKPT
jgi:hypothetical protein